MNLDGKAYLGCSWLKEKHIVFAFLFKYFAIIFCGELDSFKNKTFFAAIILLLLLYYYPFWLLKLCRVWKLRNFSSYLAASWKFRINTHRNEKYNGDWKLWIYIYIYVYIYQFSCNLLWTFSSFHIESFACLPQVSNMRVEAEFDSVQMIQMLRGERHVEVTVEVIVFDIKMLASKLQ